MTAAERYERACLEYLRLVFSTFSHVSEDWRMAALRHAAMRIMTAPGGHA